jgi:hypothetical protein
MLYKRNGYKEFKRKKLSENLELIYLEKQNKKKVIKILAASDGVLKIFP